MATETSFIGESSQIKKLIKQAPKFASSGRHLYAVGQQGTGRATYARIIHEAKGKAGDFISYTSSTAHEEDITGALENEKFSTILFRDIEEFSFVHQAAIVNFLKQPARRSFTQLILTSSLGRGGAINRGKLMEELAKELSSFDRVEIPSLAERKDDIPLLMEHFARGACRTLGLRLKAIDVLTVEFLVRREWKDNVRELKAAIEKAVISSPGQEIELPPDLVDEFNQVKGLIDTLIEKKPVSLDRSLFNLERTIIQRALVLVDFNQSKAARLLDVSEQNLRYRMKKFGISSGRSN
jgi:DNA-binding NtrC family response regulator